MLDSKQCHKLLLADRTRDVAWVRAAIEHLMVKDPDVTLDEIETVFRDAAAHSYVIACQGKFEVVIGMQAMLAAVAAAGMTVAENRAALSGEPLAIT